MAPRRAGAGGAFLTGAALAIGWTPCVGYVLGAILTMAATSQSAVVRGAAPARLLGRPRRAVRARRAGVRLGERAPRLWSSGTTAASRSTAGVLLVVFGVLMMFGVLAAALALAAGVQPGRALSPSRRAPGALRVAEAVSLAA